MPASVIAVQKLPYKGTSDLLYQNIDKDNMFKVVFKFCCHHLELLASGSCRLCLSCPIYSGSKNCPNVLATGLYVVNLIHLSNLCRPLQAVSGNGRHYFALVWRLIPKWPRKLFGISVSSETWKLGFHLVLETTLEYFGNSESIPFLNDLGTLRKSSFLDFLDSSETRNPKHGN